MQAWEQILGTTNKVRILRVLVTLTRSISGREAARLAGVSSKAIYALDELAESGVVTKREGTGQFLYSFNRRNMLAKPLVMLFRAEERRTTELHNAITATLSNEAGIVGAALFGSRARRDAKPDSDLDLLVVVLAGSSEDLVYDALLDSSKPIWERFGVRLSPVVVTKARWLQQVRGRDPFAEAVMKDSIVVAGALPQDGKRIAQRKKNAS